ncbi:restriction endonuclease subunit S [Photobacterium phosphoreum]|uniref:restriction endonuclease subunit S n=1 Tax=Photobacterium phosphoreum TaxID=659 RepID=UPI000D1585B9|nr:restriction endonuclease subunit S [Photobacterium phosphoreum]PSU66913.1 restriction endonuclease subunit S [Photobacterium phosphoreum]PSW12101.1 restriction endonuclease subunit S [Photobacterium phosphoreum]
MSKYQTYPEYKDSNSKWLGEIPSHWQRVLFKRVVNEIKDGTHGTHQRVDDGCVFLSAKNVFNDGIRIGESESRITNKDFEEIVSNGFPKKGDLLITCVGTIGRSCVYTFDEPIAFQRSVAFLRLNSLGSPSFYKYYVESKSYQEQLEAYSKSSAQSGVYMGDIINTAVVLVPMREQTKIAAFLNHETAKIDTLIEKQQKLIELLKEKRQAVISHAVTKGLNPDAPMKDSGVEWLGEVPEHWSVSKIKNFATIESGHTPSKTKEEYWINCTIPWVSLNDSQQLKVVDYIDETKYNISELGMANSSAHLLPEKAVVFTRDASIGLSAITTKPMAVSQHLIAWICNECCLIPEYLLLVFYAMESEFDRYTSGATLKTIGMDNVRSLTAAFPPIYEQEEIINWAFENRQKIKTSINGSEKIITLLKERRTALISAAVTGKIDVRHWVDPTTSSDTNGAQQEVTA